MSRKFESADPLRRGTRRPPAAALRKAAQRAVPKPAERSPAADLMHKPPTSVQGPEFQEFALKMCTNYDVKDSRYHILKFHSKSAVDPAGQFVPPIRLHRKDPKQLQVLAGEEDEDDMEAEDGGDSQALSSGGLGTGATAGNGANVSGSGPGNAPGTAGPSGAGGAGSAGGAGAGNSGTGAPEEGNKRRFGRKRKTRQVYGGEKNDAARKLRYEEHFPWVMEDFDNKNTWVSSYEAAQTNNFAILTYDRVSNGFKVIPIEKVYRMTPSARYATLSLEDAEARMESSHSMRDRWLMSHLQPRGAPISGPGSPSDAAGGAARRMRTVVGSEERQHKYNLDEEMDFDDQEMFDDDEGAPLLDGPEEDLKEAEDRIKREQLKANELMDAGNNDDIDRLFDDEEAREGKQGRRLRKALRSLEKNQYYDTDDEEHPYASSSDNESEDELANGPPNELGNPVKTEIGDEAHADEHLVLPLSQFRKKHISRDSLPRGMAVLQLPPAMLAKFAPGLWNPQIRREPSKSLVEEDPLLLTHDDVRNNIVSGETTIKQLLQVLKPKLQYEVNQQRLRQIVKEVARSTDRKLYLRE